MKLLIANRGEIAIRIARAASELEIPSVAVYSEDDAQSLHVIRAEQSVGLVGRGPGAYLDIAQIVAAAKSCECDAVHPGYGFLSENADLARRCSEAEIRFVGPSAAALELFGDKVRARALALEHDVPVIQGISEAVSVEQAREFFDSLAAESAMLIKAVSGGGGRGMRIVANRDEIDDAYARAGSEAESAFGCGDLFVERYLPRVRHIEVQIVADGYGNVRAIGDRDCTIQRRHQKIIEIAPAPDLSEELRARLAEDSVKLATATRYESLGTFEFLVRDSIEPDGYAFIEANARLQVEHTVTEEVSGIDLVNLQLEMARGKSLPELGLGRLDVAAPSGFAIQARVNMESMQPNGDARPSGGRLTTFEVPCGPRIRTDTFGYAGYETSPAFDSLLAKVIAHSPSAEFPAAVARTARALSEFRIEGVQTNLAFLRALLSHPDVTGARAYTRFADDNASALVTAANIFEQKDLAASDEAEEARLMAGAKIDNSDPLAVLAHGKTASEPRSTSEPLSADVEGVVTVWAPMQGTIISLDVAAGDDVREQGQILVMEAMKMEHEIRSTVSGSIRELTVAVGDTVYEGHPLAFIKEKEFGSEASGDDEAIDLDYIRPDLAEVLERHRVTLDEARPDAIAKRRKTNQRTARENVYDLCDDGSFVEYGQLALTPGSGLPRDEVIKKFPTDGMITGIGSVNSEQFPGERSRCVVMSYDYTVLAGTQGVTNHLKTDRMLELAHKWRRPVVLFAEGGGGRAGTGGKRKGGAGTTGAGQGRADDAYRPLDISTFATMGSLSGLVPLVGITSRFCFAGNASLLGCCDVIIATEDSSLGMGGPALIEGGGLGVFRPDEVGPMDVQVPSGVVDIAVKDEPEAVAAAKKYLSYFQGSTSGWNCFDQRHLRNIVPENRLRVYSVRDLIKTLADTASVLELRAGFGLGIVTSLVRIEGRPIGIIANNPQFLSGAIDSDGADKAARFMQLCDAFDLPIVVLCDTPGMMVGPEIERTGLVRHCSRLFVTGPNITVPLVTMVIRKAYGLGAQAMAGGDMKKPMFSVAWPTGEYGGMGLEGQMKLGFRNELAAIEDPEARRKRYDELVAAAYERGRALNGGVSFAFDAVIDPAESRLWISRALASVPPPTPREGKKRPNVDTW